MYCEHQANRIVHPTVESFYSHDEFDMLFYESDRKIYTNNEVIKHSRLDIDWVHGVEDGASTSTTTQMVMKLTGYRFLEC